MPESIGAVGLSVAMATLNTHLAFIRDLVSITGRASLMAIGLYLDGFTGLLFGRAASSVFDLILFFAVAKKVTGLSIREQLWLNWRTALSCAIVYPILYALQTPPGFEMGDSKLIQAAWLFAMMGLGLLLQAGVQGLLWIASARPNSIEVVFLSYMRKKLKSKGKLSS